MIIVENLFKYEIIMSTLSFVSMLKMINISIAKFRKNFEQKSSTKAFINNFRQF